MKVAYIAGPYTSKTFYGIQLNIANAQAYAKKYWRLGYSVICPHTNSANFDDVVSYEQFVQGYLELLRRSDIVVMLPNWETSSGAKREHYEAIAEGKKIIYEKLLTT